ncbi:MAG: hypothetical protein JRC90_05760 [Deltaproteobacteria bacterium]|nr:hypothetical protein [Deltaproteobacteria bacterium]
MSRGGARPGAGRKKKDRGKQVFFEDAESYLLAVVQGVTEPDSIRVAAAKALIAYQTAKKRGPVKSPSPGQLDKKTASSVEQAKLAEFEEKAVKIRAKLNRKDLSHES